MQGSGEPCQGELAAGQGLEGEAGGEARGDPVAAGAGPVQALDVGGGAQAADLGSGQFGAGRAKGGDAVAGDGQGVDPAGGLAPEVGLQAGVVEDAGPIGDAARLDAEGLGQAAVAAPELEVGIDGYSSPNKLFALIWPRVRSPTTTFRAEAT